MSACVHFIIYYYYCSIIVGRIVLFFDNGHHVLYVQRISRWPRYYHIIYIILSCARVDRWFFSPDEKTRQTRSSPPNELWNIRIHCLSICDVRKHNRNKCPINYRRTTTTIVVDMVFIRLNKQSCWLKFNFRILPNLYHIIHILCIYFKTHGLRNLHATRYISE